MSDKDTMVKYGVSEESLSITKTAGREEQDTKTGKVKEELVVNVSDKRVTPPWGNKKSGK